ncbi:MAG TPA: amidohydrolase, partial [Bacteroidetes bacterium]|nr:amidohydrolase [Bacteroidota bacterium]
TLREFGREAVAHGWSLAVHAIGDAAVAFGARWLASLPAPGGPHRLEHVQHVDPVTLRRLAESDIIPSIQPLHRLEDQGMLLARVGPDRAGWAFPARSLWRVNRPPALGSDWPVVEADPLKTIHAALQPRGEGEGMPGEELSVTQALEAASSGAASAAGFRGTGRLQPGEAADLVWLQVDPGDSVQAWRETRVGAVWRGGELVHQAVDF